MIDKAFRADAAISVWVIQHVIDPKEVIRRIARALRPGGLLYALNSTRCVPTDRGWVNDGLDVAKGLCEVFREEIRYALPEGATTPHLASISAIQILRKLSVEENG